MSTKPTNRISRLSAGPVWVSFRISHPVTGFIDLTQDDPAPAVRVAFVKNSRPELTDFQDASLDPEVLIEAGREYNLAEVTVSPGMDLGEHQVYISVLRNGATDPVVFVAGTLVVY